MFFRGLVATSQIFFFLISVASCCVRGRSFVAVVAAAVDILVLHEHEKAAHAFTLLPLLSILCGSVGCVWEGGVRGRHGWTRGVEGSTGRTHVLCFF